MSMCFSFVYLLQSLLCSFISQGAGGVCLQNKRFYIWLRPTEEYRLKNTETEVAWSAVIASLFSNESESLAEGL